MPTTTSCENRIPKSVDDGSRNIKKQYGSHE